MLVLALAACGDAGTSGGGDSEAAMEAPQEVSASAPRSAPGLAGTGAPEPPPQGADAPRAPGSPAPAESATVVPSMIIRTGEARVEVKSLEPAMAQVRALAQRLGGYVANTSLKGGEERVREAMLEVKVPAARFDQALSGLSPLGEVESVNVTAEDVGEEYVDVSARLANARRLEERLAELLRTRTGRLEDVLAVERELARVREEIERHEGRLRYLRTRAAVSTLTVRLHEPYPVVGDYPGSNPVLSAFQQAWRNFVGFIAFLIASLGILVPLGVVLWAAWWVFRKVRGPRKPRGTPPPPAATT
jgi:hypothetical protein